MGAAPGPAEGQRLGAVLPAVLKRVERHHAALMTIQRRWPRLVGKALARHSRPISVRRGQLIVAVDHPGEGFALNLQRTKLLRELRRLTEGKVTELLLRPGG